MIYDDVRSTFDSLAGSFDVLDRSLDQLSGTVSRAGFVAEAGTLIGLSGLAATEAGIARGNAASVDTRGPLNLLVAWAQIQVTDQQTRFLTTLRTPFDAVAAAVPDSGDLARSGELLDSLERQFSEARSTLEETSINPEGPSHNIGRLRSTVDDIAAYPVLTSDTGAFGSNGGGGGYGGGTGTTVGVRRTVDTVVRQVLGRLPKYTDARAFTAALGATFEVRQEMGHTVTLWRPRGFTGQTELGGAVSGAQASLYARAQDSLQASLPVLAGLTPLRVDADVQEMDAARSVVEAEFRSVVEELGTPGGPRAPRVDGLFDILLSQIVVGLDNQPIGGGMIGYLGSVFGLVQGQVNTIEEEQVFSNFLLLRDYISTLQASWNSFNTTFQQRDLGTLLVLLSNALQVVAESVDEVEAAMDSVFVGSAERTVARFDTGTGRRMLVSELLSWVSAFAATEAPELVQQGGRRSMGAIESTTDQLIGLVEDLRNATAADPGLPVGMRHPRVRHPLEELATYLRQVLELAADVRTV
jgi:hypothetical protein